MNDHKFLLLVTDSAAYMLKAGEALTTFYNNMVHVTCMAHALHRVAEEIRLQYPDVNKVISTVKKVFLKAPSRILLFKDMLPDVPLPPEPVLTRWGTWVEAAIYYAEHLSDVKKVCLHFYSFIWKLHCKKSILIVNISILYFINRYWRHWMSQSRSQLERQKKQFGMKECQHL